MILLAGGVCPGLFDLQQVTDWQNVDVTPLGQGKKSAN